MIITSFVCVFFHSFDVVVDTVAVVVAAATAATTAATAAAVCVLLHLPALILLFE